METNEYELKNVLDELIKASEQLNDIKNIKEKIEEEEKVLSQKINKTSEILINYESQINKLQSISDSIEKHIKLFETLSNRITELSLKLGAQVQQAYNIQEQMQLSKLEMLMARLEKKDQQSEKETVTIDSKNKTEKEK